LSNPFIPPIVTVDIFPELDCSQALGIKRDTLGRRELPMTRWPFQPRRLLVLGLLLVLAGCGGTKRQRPVGTWKVPNGTITVGEQGRVERKLPGGFPKEGVTPDRIPVFLGPLFESGGHGSWELTKQGKLRLIGKKPDGTEWSQAHDYRVEEDGEVLVISAEGEYMFRRGHL
jgi:hypothetical protein